MTPRAVALGAFIAAVAAAPALLPAYQVTLLNYVGLAAIVVLGLVLLTGVGGLTSFGQAAFVGIGAYATAWLTTQGLSPFVGLAAGLLLSGLSALAIGLVTLRFSGHDLALSTIAWSLSLYFLAGNVAWLGGHNGLTGVPPVSLLGLVFDDARLSCWLIWACVLGALLSVRNLLDSRPGRAIRCLRARATMAEAFGVDTFRLKVAIFVHAALLAGLSGWLYAHLVRFVNPTPFGLGAGIEYLFMAVIGGAGHLWGAIAGAGVLTFVKDRLQSVAPELLGTGGAVENVIFGAVMLLLLQRARGGLMPFLDRLLPARPARSLPLDAPPLPARARPERPGPLLAVEGAVRRFGGLVAVDHVSFAMQRGEILGLIGPNGAGKSTLFNLVTGVLPTSGGAIRFQGERIDGLSARAIAARGVARTFQHVQLRSDLSALENVAIGAHLRSTKGVLSAILRLDRREEAALLAEADRQLARAGLSAQRHEPAGALALGQQRILEVARALAADPLLLLLDEPAAGLRHHEKQALADLLRQVRASGVSLLVVEHDMDFVMGLVDRLVVLDFGRKIAEGTPGAVQVDPAVQEAYLGVAA